MNNKIPQGSAFGKMTVPKDYLYRQNSAVVHSPDSMSPNRARENRYNARKAERDDFVLQKKMEEDIRNKNLLVLKKKQMAEERWVAVRSFADGPPARQMSPFPPLCFPRHPAGSTTETNPVTTAS